MDLPVVMRYTCVTYIMEVNRPNNADLVSSVGVDLQCNNSYYLPIEISLGDIEDKSDEHVKAKQACPKAECHEKLD